MDIAGLLFLWCVDLAVPGLEMFCIIVMSLRSRVFALGGATGAACATAATKLLAMQGVILWLDYLPSALMWMRRCSAAVFLFFAVFFMMQSRRVKGGIPSLKVFVRGKPTLVKGMLWGSVIATINPSDILGTLAMIGCFVDKGMPMVLCFQVVIFMAVTCFLWSLFLIFVVSKRTEFFLRADVQRYTFFCGSCVFFCYAVFAAIE